MTDILAVDCGIVEDRSRIGSQGGKYDKSRHIQHLRLFLTFPADEAKVILESFVKVGAFDGTQSSGTPGKSSAQPAT